MEKNGKRAKNVSTEIKSQDKVKEQIAYFLTFVCLVELGIALAQVPYVLNIDFIKKHILWISAHLLLKNQRNCSM